MIPQWKRIHKDPYPFIALSLFIAFNLFIAFIYRFKYTYCFKYQFIALRFKFIYRFHYVDYCFYFCIYYVIIVIIPFPCVTWVWKSLVVLADYVRPLRGINNNVNPQGIGPMNTPLHD